MIRYTSRQKRVGVYSGTQSGSNARIATRTEEFISNNRTAEMLEIRETKNIKPKNREQNREPKDLRTQQKQTRHQAYIGKVIRNIRSRCAGAELRVGGSKHT